MPKLREGDPAPDAPIYDAAGRRIRLSDLWRARVLILCFLRHFG
jgi:peroxiredoxin